MSCPFCVDVTERLKTERLLSGALRGIFYNRSLRSLAAFGGIKHELSRSDTSESLMSYV